MKKALIIGFVGVLLLALAGAAYYYFLYEPPKKTRPVRDRSGDIVQPTKYSLKNETFVVPEHQNQVVLSLVAPTATRDYPMGRFTLTGSTTREGQLVAVDFFTTEVENGLRAVPIHVTYQGESPYYYLAILADDGTIKRHTHSLPLGPNIQITDVTRSGNQVSVTYQAYRLDQTPSDFPGVTTTAIIDIGNATFVQEGRKPWQEIIEEVKVFSGSYDWVETSNSEGTTVPSQPGVFKLRFDANRIVLETDCNTGGAVFTPPAGSSTTLTFTEFSTTALFCQSVEEGPYFDMIKAVTGFTEPTADELVFTLSDGREMQFVKTGTTRPAPTATTTEPSN